MSSAIHLPYPIIFFTVFILLISYILCLWLRTRSTEIRRTRPGKAFLVPKPGPNSGLYPGPISEIAPGFYPGPCSGLKPTSCVACTERFLEPHTFPAPCRHRYCADCLTDLFEHATKDESMYPPRCCGRVIPLASVRSIITPNLFTAFANKAVEVETPDRSYCANPSCHSFLPHGRIFKNIALCLKCGKTTCAICKRAAHLGSCPSDLHAKLLLKMAEKKQWQSCSKCHSLVEKKSGCNHMT
jgi:hypothetical protein